MSMQTQQYDYGISVYYIFCKTLITLGLQMHNGDLGNYALSHVSYVCKNDCL